VQQHGSPPSVELIFSPGVQVATDEPAAVPTRPEQDHFASSAKHSVIEPPSDEALLVQDVLMYIRSVIMAPDQLSFAHSHMVCS
jgi:hypothetical protein